MAAVKYTLEELKDAIYRTAAGGERHLYYDHTVKVAKFARQIMTGDDQEKIVIEYKTSESEKWQEQRIRLTNSCTRETSASVKAQYEELARTDNVLEQITYDGDSDTNAAKEKIKEVQDAADTFYQNDTLSKYLHEAVLHLNFYDPNTFIVCEARYAKDDPDKMGKPIPYPLEVYSHQAVNYEFENGVLGWMVARHECTFEKLGSNGGTKKMPIYTLYAAEYNIQMQQVDGECMIEKGRFEDWEEVKLVDKNGQFQSFFYREYNTKLQVNPAVRVGYIKDPETNRQTCVSPLWPAHHLFKDMIWTKSEYDLCRALHGFYQKFIYAPECDYVDSDNNRCVRGRCGGKECPKCGGKGLLVHTTVQDVVVVKMPKTKTDMVPLSNFVHYEHIPMELLNQHKKDLDDMKVAVMKSVFQKDLVNREEIASTATEIRDIQSSKYNVIHTYGQNWSKIWMHLVETIANYLGNEEGIIIEHDFSSDFIIETLSELFEQRSKAVESNAPYSVIRNIDRKIMMKQNRDNASELHKMDAKERWKPLKEKTDAERISIISTLPELHPLKIRYVYFEEIFSEIYSENRPTPFHRLAWEAQKAIVDKIVDRIIEENRESVEARQQFRNIFDDNLAV